jgi:hypothetical protein
MRVARRCPVMVVVALVAVAALIGVLGELAVGQGGKGLVF